ncbi:hypothetical protein [Amycolatopsis magusensis]|uniref:Uncharacterized protein n=1 Tax=Amycolatopsis magusensis TaxID=882444 RepID=A0ABS4Q3X9_9PSEU|nr:hypothetical protein [Amycolatopsis magusensis]MBP2186298.1 hypothetical protein [Amycolatopsis magusensis]MDI5976203.1 hypothetical protein [Amycolatopsis magusensis]
MAEVLVGAGSLVVLAAAAAAAGWWLPAGIALAGLLAWLAAGLPYAGGRLAAGTRAAARIGLLPLFGSAFAAYVIPGAPSWSAGVVVAVLVLAQALGLRPSESTARWITGTLLAAGLALIVLCLAIPPVEQAQPGRQPGVGGVLLAAVVVVPLLKTDKTDRRWWPAAPVAALLALSAAALYQLGPFRLGLSATSLRDLLAAADAPALGTMLAVVAALATVSASLGSLASAQEEAGRWPVLGGGLLAAVLATVLDPFQALRIAAVLTLVELFAAGVLGRSTARGTVVVLSSGILLIMLGTVWP